MAELFRRFFGDEWKIASERSSIQPRVPSQAEKIRAHLKIGGKAEQRRRVRNEGAKKELECLTRGAKITQDGHARKQPL
jgi:hypothetical protein